MLKTTKVQSSESNISIDKFYDFIISTTVHIDDDEKHAIMIVTKKNDAKFNFLIVQVSEVVYELHINFRKGSDYNIKNSENFKSMMLRLEFNFT